MHQQRRPRCFYCDTLLTEEEEARITVPTGRIYGPCCDDIAGGRAGRNSLSGNDTAQ